MHIAATWSWVFSEPVSLEICGGNCRCFRSSIRNIYYEMIGMHGQRWKIILNKLSIYIYSVV